MPTTQKQTIQTNLISWQAIAANAAPILSAVIDVRQMLAARLIYYFGLDSATAPVGTQFVLFGSDMDSGDTGWSVIDNIITDTVTPLAVTVDNAEVGPVFECGANVPALNDMILFKHGTPTLTEIQRVIARVITGGSESFTTLRAIANNTGAGSVYYNKAQSFNRLYDLSAIRRIQVMVNNNYAATAASCMARVSLVTVDSMQVVA